MSISTFFIIGVIVVTTADIAAGLYFYHIAIARSSKSFLSGNPDLSDWAEKHPQGYRQDWYDSKSFKEVTVTSFDGLKLRGYYLAAEKPTNRTVILAHGYSANARSMGNFAQFYYEKLGFNVLLPDARGHGSSEGKYIGFGWHERKDYLKWIEYIIKENGTDASIILHGVSMGGATVLATSGEQLPGNVRAIVSDCSYTSAWDELTYQMRRMYRLPSFPVNHTTSLITKLRAGYFFSKACPLKQVSRAKTPILFIHGDADNFVPFGMVQKLYDSCSSEKELFAVSGAGHGTAYEQDTEGYQTVVERFVNRHIVS